MTSFVSRKTPFDQRQKKVLKIKSLTFENSLNIINNKINNNLLYKVQSRHLVRWNTADCWVVLTNNLLLRAKYRYQQAYLKYRNQSWMNPSNWYVTEKRLLAKCKVTNQGQMKLKASLTTKQIFYDATNIVTA